MRTTIVINDNDQPYTNGDVVKGIVNFALNGGTRLVTIDIFLRGTASVRLKDHRSKVSHQRYVHGEDTFLKFLHPVESPNLRQIDGASRGRAYETPFAFTIPDELLPNACSCAGGRCSNMSEQHRYLPPTFGGGIDGAKVVYTIDVHFSLLFPDGTSTMVQKGKDIRIVPSFEGKGSSVGNLRNPVQTRKDTPRADVAKYSCGRLEAFISGPVDLQLDLYAGREDATEPSVPIELRYQPSQPSDPPPAIRKATFRLFNTTSWGIAPDKTTSNSCKSWRFRKQATSIHLETICLQGLAWTRQTWRAPLYPQCGAPRRRNCNVLTNISTWKCTRIDDPPIYTTTFRLPIRLRPLQKEANSLLPPSFSSCSMSLNHSLHIGISFQAGSTDNGRWAWGRLVPETVRQQLNRSILGLEIPIHIVYARPRMKSIGPSPDTDVFGGPMEAPCIESWEDSPPEEDPPAYTPVLRV